MKLVVIFICCFVLGFALSLHDRRNNQKPNLLKTGIYGAVLAYVIGQVWDAA